VIKNHHTLHVNMQVPDLHTMTKITRNVTKFQIRNKTWKTWKADMVEHFICPTGIPQEDLEIFQNIIGWSTPMMFELYFSLTFQESRLIQGHVYCNTLLEYNTSLLTKSITDSNIDIGIT